MHFTYCPTVDRQHLHQGDLVDRTDALNAALAEIHPHYLKADYKYFVVLTQTCDLVKRDGHCKGRYITIAAARPFRLALERYVNKLQYTDIERHFGFSDQARRSKAEQFVQRLLNNNEPNYFYYNADRSAGLLEDVCAFLRLSIALKADLHYETLLAGKVLQLKESFEHKLGYLVSSVYGRVGTEDWVPATLSEKEFQAEARSRVGDVDSVAWLGKDVYRDVVNRLSAIPEDRRDLEAYRDALAASQSLASSKVSRMLQVIRGQLEDLLPEATLDQSLRRLENFTPFRSMIK